MSPNLHLKNGIELNKTMCISCSKAKYHIKILFRFIYAHTCIYTDTYVCSYILCTYVLLGGDIKVSSVCQKSVKASDLVRGFFLFCFLDSSL